MVKRTFLVTGATKGIGRALSNRLAAAGHHVVGLARRTDDHTFPGTLVSVDLGDRHVTERSLKTLTERFAFDGIVNNMGFVRLAPVGEIDLDDLETTFRTNLTPAVQTMQAVPAHHAQTGLGARSQSVESHHSRRCKSFRVCGREGCDGQFHANVGTRTCRHRYHR